MRSYNKILRVARTIADLENTETVKTNQMLVKKEKYLNIFKWMKKIKQQN